MRIPWSIRYQLLVPLLTVLLGFAAVGTWIAAAQVRRTAERQIEERVRDVARTMSDVPINAEILRKMRGLSGAHFLFVPADGKPLATEGLEVDHAHLPPPETVSEDWQSVRLGPPTTFGNVTYLYSGVRVRAPGRIDRGTLYIFYPETQWREAQWTSVRPVLIVGLVGSLLAAVFVVWIAQRIIGRIQGLQRRTQRIAAGDFRPVPLNGADDELRQLAQAVNEMAERIDQLQRTVQKSERFRVLGQVGGGLAHQLRNSVTGARLALQLHAKTPGHADNGEAVQVALRQLSIMEEKLRRFLDLGRADSGEKRPCLIADLIGEAIDLLRPQCRHQNIDLRWHPPDSPLTVLGDAGQLGHLFVNVISNAVEAAGPNGWVETRVAISEPSPAGSGQGEGARIRIEVADSGPGPPIEVAGVLFEPFVTGKRDGVGLGLAIAKQVVEAHGGSISWKREAGTTCFVIELPTIRT